MEFVNRSSLGLRPRLNSVLVLGILALLVLSRGLPLGQASGAVTQADTHCQSALAQAYNSVNQSTAQATAFVSNAYSQGTNGYYDPKFISLFQLATITAGYPTCAIQVQSYNVVYLLHDSSGNVAGNLVITESPQNGSVLGSVFQQPMFETTDNNIWAGQQVKGDSGGDAEITEVQATWYQPLISPASGGCGSGPLACDFSTWVGLHNELEYGGGDLLANTLDQDGTAAWCNVSSGTNSTCSSTSYNAWYEVYDQEDEIPCDSSHGGAVSVSSGQEIFASTDTESSNYYDFTIEDESDTPTQTCYAGNQYDPDMSSPYFAEAVLENYQTTNHGDGVPLGTFSSLEFYNAYIASNADGYFNDFNTYTTDMYNAPGDPFWPSCGSGTIDASSGSLDSSGDFTVTYDSSQNTPSSNSEGC
jgi:hypothetical protein